jgi:hypothetical protein
LLLLAYGICCFFGGVVGGEELSIHKARSRLQIKMQLKLNSPLTLSQVGRIKLAGWI